MIRKIFRLGNSMVVSLPKEMLDALQLTEGKEVSVELDAERTHIVIAPVTLDVAGADAEFAKQAEHPKLSEFLRASPLAGEALDLPRDRSPLRRANDLWSA